MAAADLFELDRGRVWAKALRLHQWAKNLLVFVPLVLGSRLEPGLVWNTLVSFLALGLVASGTYVINDLLDLSADRRHRSKRYRPFAAGRIPVRQGLFAGLLLIGAGCGASFASDPPGALVLLAYLILSLAYSLVLKRIKVVDLLTLAVLFTLRIVLGTVVIGQEPSFWLMSASLLLFLSLSAAKRHVEILGLEPGTVVPGRGYAAGDASFTLVLGLTSGIASSAMLCLYATTQAGSVLLATLLLNVWIVRLWLVAFRGALTDDPVAFALRDRASLALGAALLATALGATLS